MILGGRDSLELERLMLTSYLDNIERIGSPELAAPYQARLEALGEQVQVLNMLCQANVMAIAEIEGEVVS